MTRRRKPAGDAVAAGVTAPGIGAGTPPQALAPASYAPALSAGLQATASRVQEMHEAIAGTTFDSLLRVPGLAVPTRLVQAVHDAIAQGVYAAVRHGGSAALALAADAERLATNPGRVPGANEQLLRSALNGAVGDALAAAGNPLAVQMAFHAQGRPVELTAAGLADLPGRVCIFIHGLACDEGSWSLRTDAWGQSPWAATLAPDRTIRYGELLARELGLGSLYLRYNTGLSLEANALLFADTVDTLLRAAPQLRELVLIGHSMGGLVARAALELAMLEGRPWAERTAMLICLGSPHQGAALARFGAFASAALMASRVTRPLGRIANARSQGVKDLGRGLRGAGAADPLEATSPVPLRLVYATLGDAPDDASESAPDRTSDGTGPSLMGRLFGDGLVHAGSAADDGLTGDVERVEVAGLGHMALLNHPRVYAVIRRWLGAT